MNGQGILKGMLVTAKNFFGSYVSRERLTTVSYPEGGNTIKEQSRNIPFLVFDGEDPVAGMRCTACQKCEKACPPQCIFIEKDKDERGKALQRPKVFDIDASVCMGCQICVEVCPFESIWMDSNFELSTFNRFEGLQFNREKLLKSNTYFHKIHPQQAQASDDRLAEKERKRLEREAARRAEKSASEPQV